MRDNNKASLTRRTLLGATGLTVASALTGNAVASNDEVDDVLSDWPDEPREIAEETMNKYGNPDGVTETRLIWHETGPWKRTELSRDGTPHNFPKRHTDYLEQFIDYAVPPEKFADLAAYDGSVIAERTRGELSARCDMEEANFLAINLADAIVTDQMTVEEARQTYADAIQQFMEGDTPSTMQGFQFDLPQGEQVDPDEEII